MGSTWQFNTARELSQLQDAPMKSFYIANEKDWLGIKIKDTENVLIKSHNLDSLRVLNYSKNLEVKILLSLRNVLDTVRSARRVSESQSDIDTLKNISDSLRCLGDLVITQLPSHLSYVDKLNSETELFDETFRIMEFLGFTATDKQIAQISSSLSKDSIRNLISSELKFGENFSLYDENTHWHGNHIAPIDQKELTNLLGFEFVPQNGYFDIKAELNRLSNQTDNLKHFLLPYSKQRDELTQQRDELINSTIWRVTKPFRKFINFLKRFKQST